MPERADRFVRFLLCKLDRRHRNDIGADLALGKAHGHHSIHDKLAGHIAAEGEGFGESVLRSGQEKSDQRNQRIIRVGQLNNADGAADGYKGRGQERYQGRTTRALLELNTGEAIGHELTGYVSAKGDGGGRSVLRELRDEGNDGDQRMAAQTGSGGSELNGADEAADRQRRCVYSGNGCGAVGVSAASEQPNEKYCKQAFHGGLLRTVAGLNDRLRRK